MGTDKALLPIGGQTLIEYMATQVRDATGNATIVADPERYARFGFPVIADHRPGYGPLGGLITALEVSIQPWNLIVACDMPNIDTPFLRTLLKEAMSLPPGWDCVAPLGPSGPEPLCAIYHRDARPKINDAFNCNILKMRALLALLETRFVAAPNAGRFRNINTPEDWAAHE
jgi:molybdenum cofactor guanylyltransferase